MDTKISVFSGGLIWFGAAVSIAEILTGTFISPLGLAKGILAIVIGHAIGCALLFSAGLIGARREQCAMDTVKLSFGSKGTVLFSALNILQLIGWSAVMILSGGLGANLLLNVSTAFWCAAIGALIIVWVLAGVRNIDKLNTVSMAALFVLSIVLLVTVFRGKSDAAVSGEISFGAAVELSAAMPLSWLPLISDYTRFAKRKTAATLVSAAVYFFASTLMYIIGLGAAIFTGENDIARIMASAGFGIAGVLIIVLSTVTTTFLDVFSAGVSFKSIFSRAGEKSIAIAVCVIGTALACFTPINGLEPFLYLIGSVFAPMTAILITDAYILKSDVSDCAFGVKNLIIWAAGFALHRVILYLDSPLGSTLPVMIITAGICLVFRKRKKIS